MNPVSSLALACLLSIGIPAQQSDRQAAWRGFERSHGTNWTVQWNPATGTPAAIFGPGLALADGEVGSLVAARAASTALLDRFHALLGRGASTFVENIAVRVDQVFVFVYDQRFRGLPVISGRADVRIHAVGRVAMFGSSAVRIPDGFDIAPKITRAAARLIGEQHVLGGGSLRAGVARRVELVIWADTTSRRPTQPVLAWEVQVDERPRHVVVGKVYVDARGGGVLAFANEVLTCHCAPRQSKDSSRHSDRMRRAAMLRRHATAAPVAGVTNNRKVALTGRVMGWTNLGTSAASPLTNVPMPRIQVTSSAGNAFTDANGDFSIPYAGSAAVTVTARIQGRHVLLVRSAQGAPLFASALVSPGTPATLQLGTPSMGEAGHSQTSVYWHVDDVNVWLRGLLPAATGPLDILSRVQPTVNINATCNAYYTANTINFYKSGGGCSMTAFQTVIHHEWGHGLDDVFGGISQIDGLSEGWGDVLAIYRSRQPEVAPGFFNSSSRGIRTALNTRVYPAGGGVHTQGQTWMGWAWDLRANLMASLGNTVGEARAHAIVVASIVADARNQPDAVREVFILDDDDGNLNNGTPNYGDLERASLKRRLPYPRKDPAEIAVFGAGCPSGSQGPQVCAKSNWTQQLANQTTAVNRVGVFFASQDLRSLAAVELYTRARSTPTAVNVTIHELDSVNFRPRSVVLTAGTVTVGTTAGAYRAVLNPALQFTQSRNLCLVFDRADRLILPTTSVGENRLHFEFTTAWGGPLVTHKWQYQLVCDPGFLIPRHLATQRPVIGTTIPFELRDAPPNRSSVLALGLSNTTWNSVALPLLYAAPCNLYTSLDSLTFVTSDGKGGAVVQVPIPDQGSLAGLSFYTQFLVSDPVNAFGLIATNAVAGKVGKH